MADIQVLPLDAVQQIRHPKQVFTDAYLNDPIAFDPDDRFDPISAIRQVAEVPVVSRDLGEYLTVNLNAKQPLAFPISMYAKVFARSDYRRIIDRQFRHFPTK